MQRHILFGIGTLLLVMGISVFFIGEGQGSLCSVASAQDNPCLAQEATNSALQIEVLSANATSAALQVENLNLQATITALEAQGGGSNAVAMPGTSAACQPYPISETFDDNTRGISTVSQEAGRARVVDGILEVRYSDAEDRLFVPLPGVCAENNFYVEVTIHVLEYGTGPIYGNFGLAIGDAAQSDYHVFSINRDKIIMMDITGQARNETLIDGKYGDIIPDRGAAAVRLGLEGKNGIVTMYVNDEEYDAYPIPFKGNAVAIYVGSASSSNFGGTRISFDNFIARSAR